MKLCAALGCEGTGIVPSARAVADGNRMAIELDQAMTLARGTRERLPIADEPTDLFPFHILPLPRRPASSFADHG